MAPTMFHRFHGRERCDECGARQWYAEDTLRYCRNGHRLEGFAEHVEDEDAFSTRGKVSRRQREPRSNRDHPAVKLTGDDARELYLEALQFVLMKLVRGLLERGSFPADYEAIVRALWTLRVRDLPLREVDDSTRGAEAARRRRSRSASSAASFSSELGADDGSVFSDTTTASWAPDARRRWKLPRLIDALALCYLGGLVMRLPITTADFCNWVQRGELDYLAVINSIPHNVRQRLPAEYHRALQVRDHIPLGHLQAAVQGLVIAFKIGADVVFPPLNYVPILVRFITELTLPAEIYSTAKCIAAILKTDYSYPTRKGIRKMSNPEVLLISLVVVSAKLLYSLDGVERPPRNHHDPRVVKVDWAKWQEAMRDDVGKTASGLPRGEEYKVTSEDVLTMEAEKLDDFMDWFEKMWISDRDPKTAEGIRELFETPKRPPDPADLNESPQQDNGSDIERAKRRFEVLNNSMVMVEPVPDDDQDGRGGNERSRVLGLCPVWRSQEDLPGAARELYERAASLVAIKLDTLIRMSVHIERQLELWCMERARQQRGKGKGKATRTGENEDSDNSGGHSDLLSED
ncbi:hypothetical protein GGS23DRAFT_573683 [Durotheca rogersii]|uniref:uncharacterized protein n=1 Tax=Durotheca rogersii TaxID=419775 RepID=UPI00222009F7|nr:uncharacterized protein GGS23DRAFT_573683 [Durotheca rogersii]KAI5861893.1 hypothetical protein GGS23DRAFT_573683 [Durotheca rogersii]